MPVGAEQLPTALRNTPGVAVANNEDGRLEAFWLDGGTVMHAYQLAPNAGWSAWMPLLGETMTALGDPMVALDGNGRLNVVIDTTVGTALAQQVAPNSVWAFWQVLAERHGPALGYGAGIVVCPAVSQSIYPPPPHDECSETTGPLEVYYTALDEGAVYRQEQAPFTSDWSSPHPWVPNPLAGEPLAGALFGAKHTLMGTRYLALVGASDSAVCPVSGYQYGGCANLGTPPGGFAAGRPVVTGASNADGRGEVYTYGADGAVWHAYELAINSWTGWEPLFRPFGAVALTGGPQVQMNTNGTLELVMAATDGTVWHTFQGAPNSAWGGWYPLGPSGFVGSTAIALAANADGRLEEFNVKPGPRATVTHAYQDAPSTGPWSAIIPL